jgi:hypothetical protein
MGNELPSQAKIWLNFVFLSRNSVTVTLNSFF